nr:hypothetical protein [uncultured Flavobacterium sp.]
MNLLHYIFSLLKLVKYLLFRGNFFSNIRSIKVSTKDCYILGNGPSLIEQLKKAKTFTSIENLFVVNNFVLTDYYKELKPKYYVFADPCYWDDKMHLEDYLKSQEILSKVAKETDWEINIIAPNDAEIKFKEIFSGNKNIKLYFINSYTITPLIRKITYFLYSKFYSCPQYQNVLVLTTFLAINIGFKEINLLGAEHSWTENIRVNDNNEVCLEDKHFYDLQSKLSPWIKVDGTIYKMGEILSDLSKMFQGYYYVKDYAEYKNAEVYNCTPKSYIDAFKRKFL